MGFNMLSFDVLRCAEGSSALTVRFGMIKAIHGAERQEHGQARKWSLITEADKYA